MKREILLCVVMGSVLTCCVPVSAQEKGNWRAANSTAHSITGDVALSDSKISINFSTFTIARIRSLTPEEIGAAFDADSRTPGSGSLYRLSIPAAKTFLHRNTLCGAEDTAWMATYVAERTLYISFFSGEKPPVFTMDALANSTDRCGSFSYVR